MKRAKFHRLQLADGADAIALQRRIERLADAPDHRNRFIGQKSEGLFFVR